MPKFIFIIFICCSILSNRRAHDVHVSVTDVLIDESGLIKLTSKIFYDDLQLAMGLIPGEELPKKYKGGDDLIAKFLAKNIKLSSGKVPIVFTYKSSKAGLPAIWAYAEGRVDLKKLSNELVVENTMFISTYDDQINMVNITISGKAHHLAFSKKKISAVVKIRS